MTQYIVNGVEFKTGDKVRVERKINSIAADGMGEAGKWNNSWVDSMDYSIGKEFTIDSISSTGARFKGDALGYPLTALTNLSALLLKAGDVVRCTDSGRMFITYGKEYTVQVDQESQTDSVKVIDNDGDLAYYSAGKFELVRRAGEKAQAAARKLKLPLAITRLGGSLVVLTAGPKDGEVTLVYAESGTTATYTESEVLAKLDANVWTVNGADDNAQTVADAEAALQAAKDALAAAEAALAEATAARKPYLA